MAMRKRARSGRFMKSNSPRRRARRNPRRRARRNYYGAGMLVNRPRRRRARTNPRRRRYAVARHNPRRRRHYRSNPRRVFGFELPPIEAVLFTGIGLIAPNQIALKIMSYLPDSVTKKADGTTSQPVAWGVKIATALLLPLAVRKFVSQKAGNYMLIGSGAGLVLDAVKTFMPGVIPGIGYQTMLGEYQTPGLNAYFQRSDAQPYNRARVPLSTSAIVAGAPDRLDPSSRF
jgi:hypothetical protein